MSDTTSRGYPLMADNEGDKPQAVNDAVQAINDDVGSLAAPAWGSVTDKPLDSAATPSTVVIRDSSGNAQVADPVASADIATKNYVLSQLTGGVNYQGTWDASANSPALASGVGTKGWYYKVTTAGTTAIDGNSDWNVNDWIIFNGTTWDKVDNSEEDATTSLKGRIKLAGDLGGTASSPSVLSLTFPSSVVLALAAINDGDFLMRSGTNLAGGRPATRVNTITSSSTPSPDADTTDLFTVTALAAAATFAAPSGTPADGQKLMVRIKDNGTAQTLAWNSIYRSSTDVALPTTTTISKTMYVGFQYNGADSKWDCLAVNDGF